LETLDITGLCAILTELHLGDIGNDLRLVRNSIKHSSPDKRVWRTTDFQKQVMKAAQHHASDLDLTAAFATILTLSAEMCKHASTASSSSSSSVTTGQ
jgi:hypothetical protein